jgi:hypothetical protein
LTKIDTFKVVGSESSVFDWTDSLANLDAEEDDIPGLDDTRLAARSKLTWPTWICPHGNMI